MEKQKINTKKTNNLRNNNNIKPLTKKNTSLPKNINKPKAKIIRKAVVTFSEMEISRIFIELLTPMINKRNFIHNSIITYDLNKCNQECPFQGVIYKKTRAVNSRKVNEKRINKPSDVSPEKKKIISATKTPHKRSEISKVLKLAQISTLKKDNYFKYLFYNKQRNSISYIRIIRAFDEDVLKIYDNLNLMYSTYLYNQNKKDSDTLNSTICLNKTDSQNSSIQSIQIQYSLNKIVKPENNNMKALAINMKKLFDIGLTNFPAKKNKSKKDDLAYITAARAAKLIRRMEYSNYVKHVQPKTKKDYINILNINATILQRWWRKMLTQNTFYYKIITIQKVFRGHVTKNAFKSARRIINPYIPFFSKIIFIFNKARFEHLYNHLLNWSAYLYQYTIIEGKLSIIIKAFRSYIQNNSKTYDEMRLNRIILKYSHTAKYFGNLIHFKSFLIKIKYLQRNIALFLFKRKKVTDTIESKSISKVINLKNKKIPSWPFLKIITVISKYAFNCFFKELNQYNNSIASKLIHQKEVLTKVINKRHLKNCLKWLKRQLHRYHLKRYLAIKLIKLLIKFIVFLPVITRLSHHIHKGCTNNSNKENIITLKESNSSKNGKVSTPNKEITNEKLITLINKIHYIQLRKNLNICSVTTHKRPSETENKESDNINEQTYDEKCATLGKIVSVLMIKKENLFRFYFSKFIKNSLKGTIISSERGSDFIFSKIQNKNHMNSQVNSTEIGYENKVICYAIQNNVHCTILRRLFSIFKSNTTGKGNSRYYESKQYKSKLIEKYLRNFIEKRYCREVMALSEYFSKFHLLIYFTQLEKPCIQSSINTIIKTYETDGLPNDLPQDISHNTFESKANTFNPKLEFLVLNIVKYHHDLLLVSIRKWKDNSYKIKINQIIRLIQRNWRLKLLPKQKFSIVLITLFKKKRNELKK